MLIMVLIFISFNFVFNLFEFNSFSFLLQFCDIFCVFPSPWHHFVANKFDSFYPFSHDSYGIWIVFSDEFNFDFFGWLSINFVN